MRLPPHAITLLLLLVSGSAFAEELPSHQATLQSWQTTKKIQLPKNELPTLYAQPYQQPLSTMAWEDGVYISRDGLTLYADFIPSDLIKAVMDGAVPFKTYLYGRGSDIGQDLSNPFGKSTPWPHGDIVYSNRQSVTEPFQPWQLTQRKGHYYNLGGAQGIQNELDKSRFDIFVFTDDKKSHINIMMLRNSDRALSGDAVELPANVNNPEYNQDNPHVERPYPQHPEQLVLYFDSDNRPGRGKHDIWFTLSTDSGNSWSDPQPATSINTEEAEQQPHLYEEAGYWWLYYAATNPQDHKLAIYRARQSIKNDWDSWTEKELVVSAGNAVAVGEPSLTTTGDLSFVVITHNAQGTNTDQFDCDPWYMPRLSKSHF